MSQSKLWIMILQRILYAELSYFFTAFCSNLQNALTMFEIGDEEIGHTIEARRWRQFAIGHIR